MSNKKRFMAAAASVNCVICRKFFDVRTPAELHHIGEGSGLRSDYMVAALCVHHHRIGESSLHGAGVKAFCRMFGLPSEYHLLELQNEFMSKDGVIKA